MSRLGITTVIRRIAHLHRILHLIPNARYVTSTNGLRPGDLVAFGDDPPVAGKVSAQSRSVGHDASFSHFDWRSQPVPSSTHIPASESTLPFRKSFRGEVSAPILAPRPPLWSGADTARPKINIHLGSPPSLGSLRNAEWPETPIGVMFARAFITPTEDLSKGDHIPSEMVMNVSPLLCNLGSLEEAAKVLNASRKGWEGWMEEGSHLLLGTTSSQDSPSIC